MKRSLGMVLGGGGGGGGEGSGVGAGVEVALADYAGLWEGSENVDVEDALLGRPRNHDDGDEGERAAEEDDADWLMEDAHHHHDTKRARVSAAAALSERKRPWSVQDEQDARVPRYTKLDLERAREDGRSQATRKFGALLAANEALRTLCVSLRDERDRLAKDQAVLKAGVNSLNAKRFELMRELEHTQGMLRAQVARYAELERAVNMRGLQLGVCRVDSSRAPGGPDDFNPDIC